MVYTLTALLALLVNLIMNRGCYKYLWIKRDVNNAEQQVKGRYAWFLLASDLFFLTETCWGSFYEHHDRPGFLVIIYSITVFYFIFMFLTALTWAGYVGAYLSEDGIPDKRIGFGTWTVFIVGLLCLIFNRFTHFIFYFNDAHEYVPGSGRQIAFILQFIFYAIIWFFTMAEARRISGRAKTRYIAVAYTSLVLGIFMFLQILFSFYPLYVMGLLVGACVVHSFVEEGVKKEKEIRDKISSAMAEDYESIFYIDIENGEYLKFARRKKNETGSSAVPGKNFYKDYAEEIAENAFPEDREAAQNFFKKENMIACLEGKRSFSCKYRFMVNSAPRFFLITYMRADDRHFILYEKDIEDELMAEKKRKERRKKTITFTQIAESLASNYDEIYYVNIDSSSYVSYEANNIYGQLEISKHGEDFFGDVMSNIPQVIHRQDQEMLVDFFNRDNLITALDSSKVRTINYRISVDDMSKYARVNVRKSSDGKHFIICVENIDEEIKREKQHLKALKTEKELARRDELTGIKNKTAYKELEQSVQSNIDNGMDYIPFALIVCDANNLKEINDTMGHAVGDEYIKASAKMLCDIFKHSPVFRVGGDEFVVFLSGEDYEDRAALVERLRGLVLDNKKNGSGPVLASGIAEYKPETDSLVLDIFDRADKAMYENKQMLKGMM